LSTLSPLDVRADSGSLLYEIIHDSCIASLDDDQQPLPCKYVDISTGERNGYAVLKDKVGIAQFLLIPTRRITGIESPELLSSDIPNYWRAAWKGNKPDPLKARTAAEMAKIPTYTESLKL
jgi:CDP-diacylglycerol pyrophosphatase